MCKALGWIPLFSKTTQNLGVIRDASLYLETHIPPCKSIFLELYTITHIWLFLSVSATQWLMSAIVLPLLDYCKALFIDLPNCLSLSWASQTANLISHWLQILIHCATVVFITLPQYTYQCYRCLTTELPVFGLPVLPCSLCHALDRRNSSDTPFPYQGPLFRIICPLCPFFFKLCLHCFQVQPQSPPL